MALDLGRWFKYAQAKLDRAVRDGNAELDQLEAEREAELADRPWLADDAETPSFDDAKARIEHRATDAHHTDAPAGGAPSNDRPSPPVEPLGSDPEVAAAKAELARREHEAAARLDAIREELGIDRSDHEGPGAPEPPGSGSP